MFKYDTAMMETAIVWSKESYCKRNKVGAVLSREGRIVSVGYNGTISGAKNECEEIVKREEVCSKCYGTGFLGNDIICQNCINGLIQPVLKSKNTVVHAEANALMFASKNGISTDKCTLYITLSPCIECAKMIIQSGIKRVVYKEDYRITDGIDFLKEHKIDIVKHKG